MTKSNIQKNREREEKILQSLDCHGYMTRSQLQRLHSLGSNRNACRVLKNMDKYLTVRRMEENVYYLNKTGRELIGSDKIRSWTNQIEHHLMRNELYLYMNKPKIWEIEHEFKIKDHVLRPDVVTAKKVLGKDQYVFVEIDNKQSLVNNLNKIRKYKEIKKLNAFQQQFGYFPIILWVTKMESRKKEIQKYCEGLKTEILTLEEIK